MANIEELSRRLALELIENSGKNINEVINEVNNFSTNKSDKEKLIKEIKKVLECISHTFCLKKDGIDKEELKILMENTDTSGFNKWIVVISEGIK